MENQTTAQTHTIAFTQGDLNRASDAQLEDLIKQASALLEKRETDRKREAIAQIKDIAKAHGLTIALEPKNTKTGRRQRRKATA